MSNGLWQRATTDPAGTRFEDVILPHIDAAHRLARWLVRNEQDAEDAVQESLLRALRYFRTFTGVHGRGWFLKIVRNTCWGGHVHRVQAPTDPFDEERHSGAGAAADPESLLLRADVVTRLERAMSSLPDRAREVLVSRELEGLSYRELADVMGVPLGTVMSSLWRARRALRDALAEELEQPVGPAKTRRQRRGVRQGRIVLQRFDSR